MANLVLYRKYRPKTFSEVIGQEHVVRTLTNAISMDMISHAYLFSGPRGSGKTSVARLLAKTINCENRKGSEPCNKCSSCVQINEGNAIDLVEIDAASNRGIDDVRDIVMTWLDDTMDEYDAMMLNEPLFSIVKLRIEDYSRKKAKKEDMTVEEATATIPNS